MQPPCQTRFQRLGYLTSLVIFGIPFFLIASLGCELSERSETTIHVLVAASAADATQKAADSFVSQLPDAQRPRIVIASGASSSLAQQIIAGAPADIFISANPKWSEAVSNKSSTTNSLLTNRLVLATPKTNSLNIASIEDLSKPSVKTIAIAGNGVPVGDYARQVIDSLPKPQRDSIVKKLVFAKDSSALVAWLETNEIDAGFIYASDLQRSLELHLAETIDENNA